MAWPPARLPHSQGLSLRRQSGGVHLNLHTTAPPAPQWLEAAAGYFTGMFCTVVCYVIGMHAALGVDR